MPSMMAGIRSFTIAFPVWKWLEEGSSTVTQKRLEMWFLSNHVRSQVIS